MEHSEAVKKARQAWVGMIRRCTKPGGSNYHRYGGRGIYVCERWLNSVDDFIEDVGLPSDKNQTLGRIDNNAGYTPGNCRWETWFQQANNRSNSVLVEIDGETKTVSQWIVAMGINDNAGAVWRRIQRGMLPFLALTKPIKQIKYPTRANMGKAGTRKKQRKKRQINRGSCESG